MHRTHGDNYVLDSNGNRVFTESVPPTTINAGWLNSVQEEIATAIENSGQNLAVDDLTDLNNQLASAIQRGAAYDAIVTSQETFNALWSRVSANVYKIKDDIGNVYFKTPAGGFYQLSAGSSPLSDGDTWGQYRTNQATFILCDGSCYFNMGDTPGYIDINASNTIVYNMDVRGIGASASAITTSIHIDSGTDNCKLLFPSVSGRISNVNHNVMYDESNTATIIGGTITACDNTANSFYGIVDFNRMMGCLIYDLTLTTTLESYGFYSSTLLGNVSNCVLRESISSGPFHGFKNIKNISSSSVLNLTSSYTFGISSCEGVSSCLVYNITSSGGFSYTSGFFQCNNISGCEAKDILSTNDEARGFDSCNNLSACKANNIEATSSYASGFYSCLNVSGCSATSIVYSGTASLAAHGFRTCDSLSACRAKTIQVTGSNGTANGFSHCENLSSCHSDTITAVAAEKSFGFITCNNVSSSCSATAVDDVDFYNVGTTPFKGDSNTATPFGFTEVKDDYGIASGDTYTYTPSKSCMLFGFVGASGLANNGYTEIRIGSSTKNADFILRFVADTDAGVGFCFPVIAGVSVYFKAFLTGTYLTLRDQPFGTTT